MSRKTLSTSNLLPLIPMTLVTILAGGQCGMAGFNAFFKS